MAITFQNQDIRFRLKDKIALKHWMKRVIAGERKICGALNFVFTSDASLLKTNQAFLNHNTYTDIITFDSCEGNVINGDILISVERVRENAAKFGTHFEGELHRVMIHGVLHLLGYKDKSKKDKAEMRRRENAALKKLSSAF